MQIHGRRKTYLFTVLATGGALVGIALLLIGLQIARASNEVVPAHIPNATPKYTVLAWNDLGMHCYNRSFSDLAVLPPYNTFWAQVIQIGDPPTVVTDGIQVDYFYADNTHSANKINFWDYAPSLFGVTLTPDIGLRGFGLSGTMQVYGDHFEAVGVPLTEFSDSAPTIPDPYQIATIVVKDSTSGTELTRSHIVTPVSSEMHCDYCHTDNGDGNEGIATGVVEQNILTKHDQENMQNYPAGHTGALMNRRPVLCAECHSSNALGAPGVTGLPSLSNAMHDLHDEEIPSTLNGCYSCHPGPKTECLRGVMSQNFHMTCPDCHGTMFTVSRNPNPWLNEPRCDNAACHGTFAALDQPLYRNSKGHGDVYCEGCHDSTHAIAPSRQPQDGIKFIELQMSPGPLRACLDCHATLPTESGPHGLAAFTFKFTYLPLLNR